MKKIKLTGKYARGRSVQVDDKDYDYLIQWNWYSTIPTRGNYALARIKGKAVYMHRLLLGLKTGDKLFGDHKDHNGLNNQRSNLRVATGSENTAHRSLKNKKASKFLGVHKHQNITKYTTKSGKVHRYIFEGWRAEIQKGNKKLKSKCFKTQIEAALWYDKHAKLLHKEFATLNFPTQ